MHHLQIQPVRGLVMNHVMNQIARNATTIGVIILCAATLSACGGTPSTSSDSKPAAQSASNTDTSQGSPKKEANAKSAEANHTHADGSQEHGEIVEVEGYHLELFAHKENNATHMDLLVQKGDQHETVTNAKITAQIQLPDGSSKSFNLAYKPAEKVYSTDISSLAAGAYKVAVLSELEGKKVNARFNLKL